MDKVGYIKLNNNISKFKIRYLYKLIFKKTSIYCIDEKTIEITINKIRTNDKYINKLSKKLSKNKISMVAFANNTKLNEDIFIRNNIIILDGKILMKKIIIKILEHIFFITGAEMSLSDIYITIKDDKEIKIILDIAQYFKCINIVSDKIKKLTRLEKKLEQKEDIIYSVSSNRNKSLKKAKIIVNFDYDSELFEEYSVNRNAIIINLNQQAINIRSSFHGIIIENFDLGCNSYKEGFKSSIIYEGDIYNLKYEEAKEKFVKDRCYVKALIGKNGIICKEELKRMNNT